jgi:hypothetical protein
MQTTQITKGEWPVFFDRFSRKHQGGLATLEIFGPDLGAQIESRNLPFEGITDEWNEAEGDTIMIMAGGETNDHVTHVVKNAADVNLQQTDEGYDAALAIKSLDDTTALLRFS